MEWWYTFGRVNGYAYRYGYVVRRYKTGYGWSCILDPNRVLGVGTLREIASQIKQRVTAGRNREPPSLSELAPDD